MRTVEEEKKKKEKKSRRGQECLCCALYSKGKSTNQDIQGKQTSIKKYKERTREGIREKNSRGDQ